MKAFSELYLQLEALKDESKINEGISKYFQRSAKEDQLWAIALCLQKAPKKITTIAKLKSWVKAECQIPEWLFDESLLITGDRVETIALLARNNEPSGFTLGECCRNILTLEKASEEDIQAFVLETWQALASTERYIFNKLLTGGFRMNVSVRILSKALSKILDVSENAIAGRLSRKWDVRHMNYDSLLLMDQSSDKVSKPYPFYLGSNIKLQEEEIIALEQWVYEPKWNGLRCQIIKRENHLFIWNRSGDLITTKFPEFEYIKEMDVEDFVIDGTIVPVQENKPISNAALERRLNLKSVSKKIMEEVPVVFVAYDIMELDGQDIRQFALTERRNKLETLAKKINRPNVIWLSTMNKIKSWDEINVKRLDARKNGTDGVVIKHKAGIYEEGRKGHHWRKWKNDPLIISTVLVYVQSETGRGISGIKEGTFAVREDDLLIPIGRIPLNLPDEEMKALSTWAKTNVIEKFGPVRSVNAEQVFKIGFEEVILSSRHKAGLVLKNPFIIKWQKEADLSETNYLSEIKKMIY